MRSIWKGYIRFSLVTIPIRLYSAIEPSESIHFNLVHRTCHGPVGYDKRCKKCNQLLTMQDIVKGYQYEPERYVILEPEDLAKVRLASTKVIEVEGFIDSSEMDPMLYESPYFVGPDGAVAAKTYALFREALQESGKVAVGRVVLRDREDAVSLSPHNGGLVLYKLRYANEVRSIGDVPELGTKESVNTEQLKLARNLLDSMTRPLGDIELKDRYGDALRELIDAKIRGEEVITVEEEPHPVTDIMKALKQSIEQAKAQRQPMIKATGKVSERKPAKGRKRA